MTPMPSSILLVTLTALGAEKMDRMRGPLSTTWGQYITSWASYATSVSAVPQWHWTPSANMDATLAQIKVLPPERAHSACLIQSLSKEEKAMLFIRPPFPRKARRHWLSLHWTSPASKQILFISQRCCWSQLRWFSLKIKQNKLRV